MTSPAALVRRAVRLGIDVLAVTDHDTWQGSVDALGVVSKTGARLRIVIASEDGEPADDADEMSDGAVAVGPGVIYGEFGPTDRERFHEALPIGPADVDLVRELLARGGLRALVNESDAPAAGSGR
jgi:hypothetical protein